MSEELQIHELELVDGIIFRPDLSDPIDVLLNDYRNVVAHGQIPTAVQQYSLIRDVQEKRPGAAPSLVSQNRGLIAAVAYPFKGRGIESKDLLVAGSQTLIRVARALGPHHAEEFNDYAIMAIEHTLSEALGEELPADSHSQPGIGPMDRVIQFVASLKDPAPEDRHELQDQTSISEAVFRPTEATLQRLMGAMAMQLRALNRTKAAHEITKLHPSLQTILPLLHLPGHEIMQREGITEQRLIYMSELIMDALGVRKRSDIALIALASGTQFELKASPPLEDLTIRERQVAARLDQTTEGIASGLGLTENQVISSVGALYRKTEARTRIELMLMAQVYHFEPTKEELKQHVPHEALEGFTPLQRLILQKAHLAPRMIAAELGPPHTYSGVRQTLLRCQGIVGVDNQVALVLEMHQRGLEFDIRKPKRPIREVLNSNAIKVMDRLADTNESIVESTGLNATNVPQIIRHSRRKLGARSREELALMWAVDATKELSPREVLTEIVGSECDIETLLEQLLPRQQEVVSARYLTGDALMPWDEVGEKIGVTSRAAWKRGTRATNRMRQLHEAQIKD